MARMSPSPRLGPSTRRVPAVAARSPAKGTPAPKRATPTRARADGLTELKKAAQAAVAGMASAAVLMAGTAGPAMADEFGILFNPKPEDRGVYVLDDAKVLKASRGAINKKLEQLHNKTGFDLFVVTTKKISTIPDPYEFADKALETWYPSLELGDRKGVLLLVTRNREGAITGGPSFMNALDSNIMDSIMDTTIPTLSKEEKFNQAASNAVDRIVAFLEGEADPGAAVGTTDTGGSQRAVLSSGNTGNILGGTLGIAYVVFIFGLVGTRAFAAADESQMDEDKKRRLAQMKEESRFRNPFAKQSAVAKAKETQKRGGFFGR